MMKILPSLLEPSRERFVRRWRLARQFCRLAQLDVLDGSFVPFRNFHDPRFINTLRPALPLEVHFMISNLHPQLPRWAYPWVRKIIFHFEATENPTSLLKAIKQMRVKVGIALSPATPAKAVYPLLRVVDTVLVMTVSPGKSGSPFRREVIPKIRALRRRDRLLTIEVDGGMTPATIRLCRRAGANQFVVGSYLKNGEFKERLQALKQSLA